MQRKEEILQGLNPKQQEAVTAIEGPVLILAGAGSGKTRALTHRIAYLIASGVKPEHILAVTFTNKAAGEMKQRVAALLRNPLDPPYAKGEGISPSPLEARGAQGVFPMMGTFHSVCLRMLRQDISALGGSASGGEKTYSKNFSIYDSDDQQSLIKTTMLDAGLDIKKWSPKSMLGAISDLKSELIGPEEFERKANGFKETTVAGIYAAYQAALSHSNALDFDDLIMMTVELLQKHPDVLAKYQELFKYIMIDEYQDTNHAQYAWANLLAKKYRNIAVVGDDAQSIYGWRKADIRNILDFEKDYPDAKIILLEQNYRSTQTILHAANSIIGNNKNQKQKKLWTENEGGNHITIKEAHDVNEEGEYVISVITDRSLPAGRQATILYRTHAQSRAIEESLVRHGIAYHILGGVRFYERREIKDILAYLRLMANPDDMVSFRRVSNTPPRGLGPVALKKKTEPYQKFVAFLEELRAEIKKPLVEFVRHVIKKINYEAYIRDRTTEGEERWENVNELLTATVGKNLEQFLEEVALIQETDKLKTGEAVVNLMTLHSAKGLEFPLVFIIGMEDGVFPHSRSLFDPTQLEEERRLCYVGVTRARDDLHLVFCRQRALYGSTQINPPSRFIFEIPEHLVTFVPADDRGNQDYVIRY